VLQSDVRRLTIAPIVYIKYTRMNQPIIAIVHVCDFLYDWLINSIDSVRCILYVVEHVIDQSIEPVFQWSKVTSRR
jgi:hypothetical protein